MGTPPTTIADFFKGQRIALTGPSRCMVGSGYGDEIESFDLVARVNHQWPIPLDRQPDVGRRMDLLYHCCNPDFSIMRFQIPEFQNTKHVFYEEGVQTSILRILCEEHRVASQDISWKYRELGSEIGTRPNTGLIAMSHLLSMPIASLKLFGFTFFKEPYYENYPGNGAKSEHWTGGAIPSAIWQHELALQFQYFVKQLMPDPRLCMDDRSLHICRL